MKNEKKKVDLAGKSEQLELAITERTPATLLPGKYHERADPHTRSSPGSGKGSKRKRKKQATRFRSDTKTYNAAQSPIDELAEVEIIENSGNLTQHTVTPLVPVNSAKIAKAELSEPPATDIPLNLNIQPERTELAPIVSIEKPTPKISQITANNEIEKPKKQFAKFAETTIADVSPLTTPGLLTTVQQNLQLDERPPPLELTGEPERLELPQIEKATPQKISQEEAPSPLTVSQIVPNNDADKPKSHIAFSPLADLAQRPALELPPQVQQATNLGEREPLLELSPKIERLSLTETPILSEPASGAIPKLPKQTSPLLPLTPKLQTETKLVNPVNPINPGIVTPKQKLYSKNENNFTQQFNSKTNSNLHTPQATPKIAERPQNRANTRFKNTDVIGGGIHIAEQGFQTLVSGGADDSVQGTSSQAAVTASEVPGKLYLGGKKVVKSALKFKEENSALQEGAEKIQTTQNTKTQAVKPAEKQTGLQFADTKANAKTQPNSKRATQKSAAQKQMQKKHNKKQYAEKFRKTQKQASAVKRRAKQSEKAAKATSGFVRRHPAATIVILGAVFVIILGFSMCTAVGGVLGSGGAVTVLSSYLADNTEIEAAELAYTEWETDLQMELASAEFTYPGYDEYRYSIAEIGHNPYSLMAYLTVKFQNFTFDKIQTKVEELFNKQYTKSFVYSVEQRYADPTDADDDGDYEPYDWRVLTVTLTSKTILGVANLSLEEKQFYDILMQTYGNRQIVGNPLGFEWLRYLSSGYGYRVHPISGIKNIHRGVDIAVPLGTEVLSTHDGIVTFAGNSGDYGNVIVLESSDGIVTKYAHLNDIFAIDGNAVPNGTIIGTVGNTGNSTGAHLHFELLENNVYLNPLFFATTGGTGELSSVEIIYGEVPPPMTAEDFTALLAVAEAQLSKPYIWGGTGPDSFDCAGLMYYILRTSGVKNVQVTGATSLYNNYMTAIPASEVQPGDFALFCGTYDTTALVSHIGLVVSENLVLHAGDPVKYTRIDTVYYQEHFYTFARLKTE